MPNIPPRGLYGRDNATWKNPVAIFARDAGVWKPAVAVYAMQAGAWQLIWAASATPPASATITYTTGQVNVSWVASTPAVADAYNIYRSDNSLAGTVAAPATTFVDPSPRPLSGAYKVFGVLGGAESPTAATSNSLDLRLQAATFTATLVGSTVKLDWTASAVGSPDSWNVYRTSGTPVLLSSGSTATTFTDPNPPAGVVSDYAVIPVLTSIEGLTKTVSIGVPANVPLSVALAAFGISNLRLTWSAPSGTVTGYEVETSTNGSSWSASAVDASPTDWATTTATGYMRVRSLSAGGNSAWVVAGPVAAINDVTPPANPTITSWKPESSYGRMVVRFTAPADTDLNSYKVQVKVGAGSFTDVGGWTAATPNTAYSVVVGTYAVDQVVQVKVLCRDNLLNTNTGSTATYTLVATPFWVDPSGDLSGTYRNAGWRNDSTRATTEIATGWTSSGHNIGCYFYGTAIATAIGTKTIISARITYWRENEGGLGAAVVPLFWTHALTGRTAAPSPNAHGVAEASRLGEGVCRVSSTCQTSGEFSLPSAFIDALKAGTAKGLCMYRGYVGSGDPDNYYALMSIGGVAGGSPDFILNGRIFFDHLG